MPGSRHSHNVEIEKVKWGTFLLTGEEGENFNKWGGGDITKGISQMSMVTCRPPPLPDRKVPKNGLENKALWLERFGEISSEASGITDNEKWISSISSGELWGVWLIIFIFCFCYRDAFFVGDPRGGGYFPPISHKS